MADKEKSTASPPYISFRTFLNFIDGLKGQVPPVIDRSVMRSMSGSLQAQLLPALRYLGLIDEKGHVLDGKLAQLVDAATREERNMVLSQVLREAYPYIFNSQENFDIETGTYAQLSGLFTKQGPSGDTLRKVENFFLEAAKYAGEKLSPHILSSNTGKSKPVRNKGTKKGGGRQHSSPSQLQQQTTATNPLPNQRASNAQKWFFDLEAFLERLPDHDSPVWSAQERQKWMEMFQPFLDFNIKIEG